METQFMIHKLEGGGILVNAKVHYEIFGNIFMLHIGILILKFTNICETVSKFISSM